MQSPHPGNNFDALRVVAALAVLVSHHYALTGQIEPSFFGLHTWGGLAVIVFFIVSGYLVTGSWINDPNVLRFGARRLLRIWPALTVAVVVTAYGLGAWVTSLPLGAYWTHRATLDYLLNLVMQIHYVLPGVFEHNPYASGVNGSLWTIPLEVRCYVVLAAAGWLGLLRRRSVWLGCIAVYMVWFIAKGSADLTGHVRYGRELSAFFLAGSALFVLRPHWQRRPLVWLLALGVAAALLWWVGWRYTAILVIAPVLVLTAGTRSTPVLRRFGRWGDPSYGAYLLAFPVQQTVVHFLHPQLGFGASLALAAAITLALAYGSWHLIEKPALRLKPGSIPKQPLHNINAQLAKRWRSLCTPAQAGGTAGPDRLGTGLPLILLSATLIVAGQILYLIQSGATVGSAAFGAVPATGAAILLACGHALLERLHLAWLRRALQTLLIGAAGLALVLTLAALGGFWQTGSIPRLQQLDGLTWNIVAPSVWALLGHHGPRILATVIAGALVLILLVRALRPLRRPRWPLLPIGLAGAALLSVGALAKPVSSFTGPWLISTQLFRSDVDTAASLSEGAQRAEAAFFRHYHQQLGATLPEPRYPDLYAQLRGNNVIWVILESVRAKDVPLYGGAADMPYLMKARQNMLILDQLYAQDPRSTKAYTQMDLGRFSLLSWNTYSNNIPWMFPKDGLANHLAQLGYTSFSLVNSDALYDKNQLFQQLHGYQKTWYRQALNPGSNGADDLKLLAQAQQAATDARQPFYMMLWPIQTHHPYGRDYWAGKRGQAPTEPPHRGAADYPRYLAALHQADDWFGRLISMLKAAGLHDNTTIIVTGDHGQAFGEHDATNVFHGNGVYEESVHIPGFIYSPRISQPHTEERYLRLMDIPATILNLAAEEQFLFNDGRSIFRNYRHEMPIYLFSSWGGAAGIIHEGRKLWRRTSAPHTLYSASMADIRRDPARERELADPLAQASLLNMLDQWQAAMATRTARLLHQKSSTQPPVNDLIRVYCDDGTGFEEARKGFAPFVGISGKVTIELNQRCQGLRIAPLQSTTPPVNQQLSFKIDHLEVTDRNQSWNLRDAQPTASNHLTATGDDNYTITGGSPYIDYKTGSKNLFIKQVTIGLQFSWSRL